MCVWKNQYGVLFRLSFSLFLIGLKFYVNDAFLLYFSIEKNFIFLHDKWQQLADCWTSSIWLNSNILKQYFKIVFKLIERNWFKTVFEFKYFNIEFVMNSARLFLKFLSYKFYLFTRSFVHSLKFQVKMFICSVFIASSTLLLFEPNFIIQILSFESNIGRKSKMIWRSASKRKKQ